MFIAATAFTYVSCKKDINYNGNYNGNYNIVNGVFKFNSKESLKEFIDKLQNKSSKNLEGYFKKLYLKGFRSHAPIVNQDDENLQIILSNEQKKLYEEGRMKASTITDFVEENQFIKDPFLAALVNSKNQIIINDSLYVIKKNQGVFYSHVKDSTYLLNSKFLKDGFSIYYDYGYSILDNEISHYRYPREDYEYGGGGNSNGGGSSNGGGDETETIQGVIDNLSICDGDAGGNWFQGFFGTSLVCRNYFDNKHRIKTEFWDQTFGFYKSVGVLTKTQRKRFWIWWASNSDEIRLGINRIVLKYHYPRPDLSSYTHPNLFNNTYKAPVYLYNGTFKVKRETSPVYGQSWYVSTDITVTNNTSLPFFDFNNTEILNIYLPTLPIVGSYNLNLQSQDIYSPSNIHALYQMGIDYLHDNFNSGSANVPENFAVTYQKNMDEVIVIYFGKKYKDYNQNILKKRFYQDASFQIKVAWGSDDGFSWNVVPAPSLFRQYTYYNLDFYGMARRGSLWKGNRMLAED